MRLWSAASTRLYREGLGSFEQIRKPRKQVHWAWRAQLPAVWDKAVLDKLVHPSRGKVTKFALTAMNKVAMPSIVKCFMTHYGAHIAVIREDDDVPLMLRWMQNPDAKNWGRVSLPVVEVVPMAGAAQSAAVAAKFAQNGNAHNDEDNAEEEEEDEEEAEELPESAAESEEESPHLHLRRHAQNGLNRPFLQAHNSCGFVRDALFRTT